MFFYCLGHFFDLVSFFFEISPSLSNKFVFRQSDHRCCDDAKDRNDDAVEWFDPSWDGGCPLTPGCWAEMTRAECHPLRTEGWARHPSAADVGVVGTDDNAAVVVVAAADVVVAVVGADDVTGVAANETDCAGDDRTSLLLLLSQGPISCCRCCCCC